VEENCHFVPGPEISSTRAGFRREARAGRFVPSLAGRNRAKSGLPKSGIGESISPQLLWKRRLVPAGSVRGTAQAPKSIPARCQAIVRQVRMYCFRFGNCGTFMPLSGVRGEFRIAVVWTWFVAVFSAISSGHFSALFTHSVFLSAVDCG
jgi:hypothetical protein